MTAGDTMCQFGELLCHVSAKEAGVVFLCTPAAGPGGEVPSPNTTHQFWPSELIGAMKASRAPGRI